MFSRIREALQILKHREPEIGPDAVIVDRKDILAPRAGRVIASTLEILVIAYFGGYVAGYVGPYVYKFVPHLHTASVSTVIGAIGFLLAIWGAHLRTNIEARLRAHLDLANALAPYFGHRLTYATRVLKGA